MLVEKTERHLVQQVISKAEQEIAKLTGNRNVRLYLHSKTVCLNCENDIEGIKQIIAEALEMSMDCYHVNSKDYDIVDLKQVTVAILSEMYKLTNRELAHLCGMNNRESAKYHVVKCRAYKELKDPRFYPKYIKAKQAIQLKTKCQDTPTS